MNYILYLLGILHTGSLLMKLKSSITLAIILSPITWVLDRLCSWHLDNHEYVSFVVGAIAIDHFLGTIYHAFYKRDFSIKKNLGGLLVKLVIVVTVGYLFEGLNTLMVHDSILKDYTVMVLRLMVFLYPASSAFGNSYVMTGRKFPPVGFMDKLKQFNQTIKVD